MPKVIAAAIKILRRDKIINTKSGGVVLADTAVKEMSKVHQLSGGTVLTDGGECIVIDTTKAGYIAAKSVGVDIAIFYKFQGELKAIKSVFPDLVIDPMEFKEKGGVFASQVVSGREGIDLSRADELWMYNVDFAAVSYWQTIARLQKMGKKKPAIVRWLMFEGGLEAKVLEAVRDKEDYTLKHYKASSITTLTS
jgi:hypothetical protein